jgi:diaminopimelate epimerase
MRFSKWHALGNAYLVVEQPDAGLLTPERVRRLCAADTGIGSHGVIEVIARTESRAEIVIWNPDGSIAEMSGNGARIAARWLASASGRSEVAVVTAGRTISARMLDGVAVETAVGAVQVGPPEQIEVAGEQVELTTASLGNPHAVVRRKAVTRADLLRLGPAIESHPRFPERTNVQLVAATGPQEIEVLVWERGAGETPASGSSAAAAAAVAVAQGWCESPVVVAMPGGTLKVAIRNDAATIVGPAEHVASGVTPL